VNAIQRSRCPTPPPLGAHLTDTGATFGVYSSVADAVQLCLFDADGTETQIPLYGDDGYLWQAQVSGLAAGQRYGFRVTGPWNPSEGHRCNPAKLLLDPYAALVEGAVDWNPAVLGYLNDRNTPSPADSAAYVPKSVLVDSHFDWAGDVPPRVPLADSIIYETHVKGFTRLLPDVPAELRGTYAGLAHPAAIAQLTRLGITAVELLPVQQFVHDGALLERGLSNYWGYQPICFLAPHNGYFHASAATDQLAEFKATVRALHAAGLEVLLDVVFNHTAEGNEWGPTLSFRGLDNAAYYRLQPDPAGYVDDTGTGNTLDVHREPALRLVLHALRYWVTEMHVDGFRFDLAAALARGTGNFDAASAFLMAIGADDVLSRVKLIAEPWDAGGAYAEGDFPPGWSEWNDRYRNTVRDFWRSQDGTLAEFATRITGSSDLFGHGGRRPTASVNLVTCHDGFTLSDLVAYNGKHNEANGQGNTDGNDDNRSWNCGIEGSTGDAEILALRSKQRRNFLATVLLSSGVPMLLGGDELGRSQQGNNNAYCQDNQISWFDWTSADPDLTRFVQRLCQLRRAHPHLRRPTFLRLDADGLPEGSWFRPDGQPMTLADWQNPQSRAVGLDLRGERSASEDVDDQFILLVNSWWEELRFVLPDAARASDWTVLLDTSDPSIGEPSPVEADTAAVPVAGRSLVLLHAR
jgi:isoamylase